MSTPCVMRQGGRVDGQGQPDELAEAIGRVAIAASVADVGVRTDVGLLGGPGVSILASEKDSVSVLIDWNRKFVDRLFDLDAGVAEEFHVRADTLKDLLARRNAVVHGLWFSEDGEGQSVAVRRRGRGNYVSQTYSVTEVNRLAQDIRNASFDLSEISQRIAHPDWPTLQPRDGRDVH